MKTVQILMKSTVCK